LLDVDAIARLRSVTLQLPLPWVFDWSGLKRVDPDAAAQLSELLRHWATQSIEMRWLSGEHFLTVLQDAGAYPRIGALLPFLIPYFRVSRDQGSQNL
jgi:hypothetical protein